jgi:sugar fermentation stimulation protein A
MKFQIKLLSGTLVKRYKRFLADVVLESGEEITVHCPNSGSMKSCANPGWQVLLSRSDNPKRKYPYTWEMVHNGKCWIGINTGIPNTIVAEAITEGKIKYLSGYENLTREVKYGENSRIDILLSRGDEKCYVEVKNVTLVEEDGNYYFPDSVTARGTKHLFELTEMVNQGHRSVMFYVIQRSDGSIFKPALHIDPKYTKALQDAYSNGVEIMVYQTSVSPESITITHEIPYELY